MPKKNSKKNKAPAYSRDTLIRLAQIGAMTIKGDMEKRLKEVDAFLGEHPLTATAAPEPAKGKASPKKLSPEQIAKMKAGAKAYHEKQKAAKEAAAAGETPKQNEELSPEVADIVGATH